MELILKIKLLKFGDDWNLFVNNILQLSKETYKSLHDLYYFIFLNEQLDFNNKNILIINGGNQLLYSIMKLNNNNIFIVDELSEEYSKLDILPISDKNIKSNNLKDFINKNKKLFDFVLLDMCKNYDYDLFFNSTTMRSIKQLSNKDAKFYFYIPANKNYNEIINKNFKNIKVYKYKLKDLEEEINVISCNL